MKKSKLTYELIANSFDFYNQNLGQAFLESEQKNLSNKLLNIIEYNHILKNKKLPYYLPQQALYLIYFIGEYKKAFQYAKQDKKDKNKNTFESLGKGFPRKVNAYKESLDKALDTSIDIDERLNEFIKSLMLLLLKKHEYKKISMYLLGSTHAMFPLIKNLFNNIHQYNSFVQLVLNAMEHTRDYFKYTHLSEDKILNSSLIVIYTFLTQNLKMDQDKAFKYSKELVNSFVDDKGYVMDKYRRDYLNRDIYYAGIYQGMPIFQWYMSKQHQPYYTDQDIKKFKVLKRVFSSKGDLSFTERFVSMSILKFFNIKPSSKNLNDVYASVSNDAGIRTLLLSSHKHFASAPFTLLQYLPKPRKPFILWSISLIIGFFTKLSDLKTKFTKK